MGIRRGDESLIREQQRISPVVYGIGFYFLIMATDSFRIGTLGSLLKVVALIPLALLLFDLKKLRLCFHPVFIAQMLFWLLGVLSLFYSINTQKSIYAVLTLTLNLATVFSLGSFRTYNERELAFLRRAMLCGGWFTILLLLVMSDFSAGGRLTLRLGGNTQDQNYINGFFLYTFSYHFQRLLHKHEKMQTIPIVLIIAIVLMTGSRGALVAFALTGVTHFCILFSSAKHKVRNFLLMLVILIGIGIVFDVILSFMPENVAVRYSWDYLAEKGTTGRTRVWGSLLNHFSQDSIFTMLFGHGYGTSQFLNTVNGNVAHNLYIDNLMTLGVIGVALQLITQGLVAYTLLRHKEYTILATYAGMIGMCMSLSLVSYKPTWNVMMLTLAIDLSRNKRKLNV